MELSSFQLVVERLYSTLAWLIQGPGFLLRTFFGKFERANRGWESGLENATFFYGCLGPWMSKLDCFRPCRLILTLYTITLGVPNPRVRQHISNKRKLNSLGFNSLEIRPIRGHTLNVFAKLDMRNSVQVLTKARVITKCGVESFLIALDKKMW